MDALSHWPLRDLIDRVLSERLVDDCLLEEEYVVIVQGSTRFVLDHQRAHAFLRGVVRGMSPAYRGSASAEENRREYESRDRDLVLERGEKSGLFDSFRRRLIRKWWDRYRAVGCPFGRSVTGLLMWIRYDTGETVN